MFKRLGVFGLMLAATGASLIQPSSAFGQDRYGRGDNYAYYGRDERGSFRRDRDFERDSGGRAWREREAREWARREHEWHQRQRWENREYRERYAPNYYSNPYYARPY